MKSIEDIHICVNSSDGTHSVERTIPLADKGFKISFIAHKNFDRVDELRKYNNVSVYFLNEINPEKKHFRLKVYINLIKYLNPDLIIVHFCGYDRFHSAVFSNKKPVVGILMGGDVDTHSCVTPLSTFLELKFTKCFLPYLELLAAKTNKIIKKLEDWNLKGKIVHIPWGVKISEELIHNSGRKEREDKSKERLREQLDLPRDKFIVLSNRNVAESGRQMEILKGFHNIVKQGLNVYLLIVARTNIPSYLKKIKDYVKENNLEDYVRFYDYIPQTDMFKYYSACDVLVSNWIHDGLPQTFFESSLRGLPIIMNDLPQYKDFYKNEICALINDGTSEGIMQNIKTLYENGNMINKISENGIKVVCEKANFDSWAEIFHNEILNLLESGRMIEIPLFKQITGKLFIALIAVCRRWPLNKIMIRV